MSSSDKRSSDSRSSDSRSSDSRSSDSRSSDSRSSDSAWAALKLGVRMLVERPKLAVLFLALTAVQGFMQGLLIWVLREVLLAYSNSSSITAGLVAWTALAVLAVWTLRASTRFAATVTTVYLGRRIEIESMWEVLRKLMRLPYRFFAESGQGDLIVSSYQDLKGIRMTVKQVGQILLNLSTLVGLLVAAWLMSPKLTAIGLVAVPLGMMPAYWMGKRVTRASSRAREATGTLYDSFLQVIAGIQVIKVNRASEYVMERAEQVGQNLITHNVTFARDKALTNFLFEVISGLGMVVILVLGGSDVAQGDLEWQSLMSLIIAVMAVYRPLKSLLTSYTSLRGIMPNLERVNRIQYAAPQQTKEAGAAAASLSGAPSTITFDEVTFAYDEKPVLHEISATFQRGETIGIVGASGAGKSTLMSLLLRYYDADAGRILFDGTDIQDLDYEDLMRQSAIVLQEPFLFIDTVAQNIRIGRPEATMEEVKDAARAANVHEEITEMDDGYETVMGRGENKRGVSVGQKQRITIAAALLKNAPLLFLDEATSNLDAVSERKVQEAIERLMEGRTTFVIAHRLSTLRDADRVMVMQDGRLAGLGTHEELMATNDIYQRLWHHQVGTMAEETAAPA